VAPDPRYEPPSSLGSGAARSLLAFRECDRRQLALNSLRATGVHSHRCKLYSDRAKLAPWSQHPGPRDRTARRRIPRAPMHLLEIERRGDGDVEARPAEERLRDMRGPNSREDDPGRLHLCMRYGRRGARHGQAVAGVSGHPRRSLDRAVWGIRPSRYRMRKLITGSGFASGRYIERSSTTRCGGWRAQIDAGSVTGSRLAWNVLSGLA
jgi:hypothetical protein